MNTLERLELIDGATYLNKDRIEVKLTVDGSDAEGFTDNHRLKFGHEQCMYEGNDEDSRLDKDNTWALVQMIAKPGLTELEPMDPIELIDGASYLTNGGDVVKLTYDAAMGCFRDNTPAKFLHMVQYYCGTGKDTRRAYSASWELARRLINHDSLNKLELIDGATYRTECGRLVLLGPYAIADRFLDSEGYLHDQSDYLADDCDLRDLPYQSKVDDWILIKMISRNKDEPGKLELIDGATYRTMRGELVKLTQCEYDADRFKDDHKYRLRHRQCEYEGDENDCRQRMESHWPLSELVSIPAKPSELMKQASKDADIIAKPAEGEGATLHEKAAQQVEFYRLKTRNYTELDGFVKPGDVVKLTVEAENDGEDTTNPIPCIREQLKPRWFARDDRAYHLKRRSMSGTELLARITKSNDTSTHPSRLYMDAWKAGEWNSGLVVWELDSLKS